MNWTESEATAVAEWERESKDRPCKHGAVPCKRCIDRRRSQVLYRVRHPEKSKAAKKRWWDSYYKDDANKKKVIDRVTTWQSANRPKLIEYKTRYRTKHHARILDVERARRRRSIIWYRARERERYASDPEKYRAKNRASYYRDGRGRERAREWRNRGDNRAREGQRRREQWPEYYKKNRSKCIEAAHKHRALILGAYIEEVRLEVLYARDGGICALCGEPVAFDDATNDHYVPLTWGGVHAYFNCQIAHFGCNSAKGNRYVLRVLATPIDPRPLCEGALL